MEPITEENVIIYGNISADERKKKVADIYVLLDFLLEGKIAHCNLSVRQLSIGMSALPRRIKDLKDYMGVKIEPQDPHAPKRKITRADGTTYRIREYFMTKENIAAYKRDHLGEKAVYPKARKMQTGKNARLAA